MTSDVAAFDDLVELRTLLSTAPDADTLQPIGLRVVLRGEGRNFCTGFDLAGQVVSHHEVAVIRRALQEVQAPHPKAPAG